MIQLIQVIQEALVIQVIQLRLAHLWLDFWVIFLLLKTFQVFSSFSSSSKKIYFPSPNIFLLFFLHLFSPLQNIICCSKAHKYFWSGNKSIHEIENWVVQKKDDIWILYPLCAYRIVVWFFYDLDFTSQISSNGFYVILEHYVPLTFYRTRVRSLHFLCQYCNWLTR